MKPLGIKNYGSIPHLIGSRFGPADHHAEAGQVAICTEKQRDKHDCIIVQGKAGWWKCRELQKLTGKFCNHQGWIFGWNITIQNTSRFQGMGRTRGWPFRLSSRGGRARLWGMALTAVGTKYKLNHEPFVIFDIMTGKERLPYLYFADRVKSFGFEIPTLLHYGYPISINGVMERLGEFGHHGQ